MSSRFHRVIYVSRWASGLGEDVGAALSRIVASSIGKNRLCNITGLLLAHEGWFVQALEGPEPAVQALIVRISRDPRHRDVQVLLSAPDEIRMFGAWSMAAVRLGAESEPLLLELGQLGRFDGHALDADAASQLLTLAGENERRRLGKSAA